jgi:hypothetical protein
LVTDRIDFGIPGLAVEAGDHICALYFGEAERDDVLLPYLRAGVLAGDKCICIVDASEPSVVLDGIGGGVDVDGAVSSHQLEVLKSTDTYLRSDQFSLGDMLEFWNDSVGKAFSDGQFRFARSVGEMTWGLRDLPGVNAIAEYESELNRFLPTYPQVILCMYDLERFGGRILVDLVKTHPKLLLGGVVIDNPYALSPDEFLVTRR